MSDLYYVSTPQGDSRAMSLPLAEEYYQWKVTTRWANDCDQQKITMHKTVVVKQYTIKDTVTPPPSFY